MQLTEQRFINTQEAKLLTDAINELSLLQVCCSVNLRVTPTQPCPRASHPVHDACMTLGLTQC
jgi:hypothetical protein